MARYFRTLMGITSGQDEKDSPFLCLPAELRNIVYREYLLKEDYITTLSQPALLRTCRQIRDEAFTMYYFNNKFFLHFTTWRGPTLPKVHKFVDYKQTSIEMHVRHIKFAVHHKVSDLGPYNEHLQHVFRNLPCGLIFPYARMGKPKAECADYSVAKRKFSAMLREEVMLHVDFTNVISDGVYDGELLPPALNLFEAVWRLAHTFPEAALETSRSALCLACLLNPVSISGEDEG